LEVAPADTASRRGFHWPYLHASERAVGLRYPASGTAPYRMIFFPFGLETVDELYDRADLLNRCINWLIGDSVGATSAPPSVPVNPAGLIDRGGYAEASWNIALRCAIEARATGANKPYILAAGYNQTDLQVQSGGTIDILAAVTDYDGIDDIDYVELYYGGQPTGVHLNDLGGGLYGFTASVGENAVPVGKYLLELVAVDKDGNRSDMWPYLTVK
jgi:hypothetical protein